MSRDAWESLDTAPDEYYVWLLYDFPKHGPTPVLGIRKPDPRLRVGCGTHSWFGPPTIMHNGRLTEGCWITAWIKGWKRFCDHSTSYSQAISLSGERWVQRDSDGTATAAANGDLPVPQDCQARAESIAK